MTLENHVIVHELKIIASLISTIQIKKEQTYGQYDVNQSINAAMWFDNSCQQITASTPDIFIEQLSKIIEQRKTDMSNNSAGTLNGGKGTLNGCYIDLLSVVEQGTEFDLAKAELEKQLKQIGRFEFSVPNIRQVVDLLEIIDDRIPLIYLLIAMIFVGLLLVLLW